ncbi:hypothetical protein [Galactobacillus timonensis]|uniref:hypothetical protein n=1 Tax=Galactobacillus timonensis TaxID=2041840 RepID=UPI001AEBC56E|nr:hypothetical protein [Galactobacillus timonensis]
MKQPLLFITEAAHNQQAKKVCLTTFHEHRYVQLFILPLLLMFAFTQKWFVNGIGSETGIKG